MVKGFFIGNTPFVEVTVASGDAVKRESFVLDTGFTGDLQVTPQMAIDLGLKVISVEPIKYGDGRVIDTPTALAKAALEFRDRFVNIVISDGSPLAGIGFFKRFGYKISVCCRTHTVELEVVGD